MGNTTNEKKFNCVHELLKFEDDITHVGSFNGEFYYLLGRAYAKKKEYDKAMEALNKARRDVVVDEKVIIKKAGHILASGRLLMVNMLNFIEMISHFF